MSSISNQNGLRCLPDFGCERFGAFGNVWGFGPRAPFFNRPTFVTAMFAFCLIEKKLQLL
ncbi:MAG: hypothetical protein ACK4NS_07925 [Saprospiraceae bacterium]